MSVSRIYRLLRLITILQGNRRYTADELAQELEVSRRTIFRDLNMLEMAHIPYYYDEDAGGYRISGSFFLPPINLTLTEALAMMILARRMRDTAKLPLLSHGALASVKLESALPQTIRRHVGSIIDRLNVSFGPVSRHLELDATFDDVAAAITDKHICQIVYISFFERKQLVLTVRPLRLTFMSRAWYLIAYSNDHREIRTFKMGRIRKLTVTAETFSEPTDVELQDYFGQAWRMIPEGTIYDVHLHFEPQVAGNVAEVTWHESQRVEWHEDGSLDYHVKVDGLGEIIWWILGYGDQVEVIAPAALRKKVADTAANMLKKHQKAESRP